MALRELRLRVPRSLIIEVVALPLPLRSAVEGARYCEICFQIGLVSLILTMLRPDDAQCPACQIARPQKGWPPHPMIGKELAGRYRISSLLGSGGFGDVYEAQEVTDGLEMGRVAVKILHRELGARNDIWQRFVREAQALRALTSPHVVKVYLHDRTEEGAPYIVMEFLPGGSLRDELERRGSFDPAEAVTLGQVVAKTLADCHENGVIHRDLKPENLILLDGRVNNIKVLDFGIARLAASSSSGTRMIGTPAYMSPEQIGGGDVDGRLDIFALGVILYEAFCGKMPLPAEQVPAQLTRNLNDIPAGIRTHRPQLPESLEQLLSSMLAKQASDRPSSMEEVEERLWAIADAQGWSLRRPTHPHEGPLRD